MSTTTSLRRSRENTSREEEEEEAITPHGSKRARFQQDVSPSESPLLPESYRTEGHGEAQEADVPPERARMKHHPGSITRVKLMNFVTYEAAEFFPGPSLNMVIGPNGTGKSTLVCAICLGLGYSPNLLGRAKEYSEFVKYGLQEAMIEIELAGHEKIREGRNSIIKCNIKREANKASFSVNGKPCSKKSVVQHARRFSIQIDNLCQFLPQDKVVEFAAMTPVELLRSTQRAVASEQMITWHEDLKRLSTKKQVVANENATDLETLANLESRQRMQEADVEMMRERENVKKLVEHLEAVRPVVAYREAKARWAGIRDQRDEAQNALVQLETEKAPALLAVNAKNNYKQLLEVASQASRKNAERSERRAQSARIRVKELGDEITSTEQSITTETKEKGKCQSEVKRLQGVVERLESQIAQPPIAFDAAAFNRKISDKNFEVTATAADTGTTKCKTNELQQLSLSIQNDIKNINHEIENLKSQSGKQLAKLKSVSPDTAAAWQWIQEHQNDFEKPILGPPLLVCSIKDARYTELVENLFSENDMVALTAQTKNDFSKLHRQLSDHLRLPRITLRTSLGCIRDFPRPIDAVEQQRLGFDGFALDFISGPDAVLAMLCSEGPMLHRSAVAIADTTQQQFDMISNSAVTAWVTRRSFHRITRRREYGAGAVSTTVKDTRRAQYWTEQPIDTSRKRNLENQITTLQEKLTDIGRQREHLKILLNELHEKTEVLEQEETDLKTEKNRLLKSQADRNGLPQRLATNQALQKSQREKRISISDQIASLEQKCEDLTISKAEATVKYLEEIDQFSKLLEKQRDVELRLIEATSDVEVLETRNQDVVDQLEAKREECRKLAATIEELRSESRERLRAVRVVTSQQDAALRAFLSEFPATTSTQELELEIQSQQGRLELMHEGHGDVIREFEKRQGQIDRLKRRLDDEAHSLIELNGEIQRIRGYWEPKLDKLVKRISDSFAYNMRHIDCAGEASVYKDENDFDAWAICIHVKFRENEPLTQLDSHRQSGGERAVSTIFYLMSLQSLTRSPFRVVDEINQGMDPRNERLVHARMVSIATGNDDWRPQIDDLDVNDFDASQPPPAHHGGDEDDDDDNEPSNEIDDEHFRVAPSGGSQYFLITPKLLHGLKYERGMRVLCIASGEYMPEDQSNVDFRRSIEIRRGLTVTA